MQAALTTEERLVTVEAQLTLLTTIGQHVSAITTLFQWFMGGLALITIVTFFREWLNSKGQRDTVALTNELLGMVKSTMAQSAGLFRRFAKDERKQVSDNCAAILRDAPADDYECRYLASDSSKHTEVRIRARDVDRLEGQLKLQRNIDNVNPLDSDIAQHKNGSAANAITRFFRRAESDNSLELPDICLFIAGMNHHLDMNWPEAINCWSAAYDNSPEWPPGGNRRNVKKKAKMWIARELNNIGDHQKALDWLQKPGDGDQNNLPTLAYTHETKYYLAKTRQAVKKVAKDAKGDLLKHVTKPEQHNRAERSAALLLGNLLLVDMIVNPDEADAENLEKCFSIGRDPWSMLGMTQYYDAIRDKSKRTLWALKVLGQLNSPTELRWEPHARLLRKSAALMCAAWRDQIDQSEIKGVYRTVVDDFGLVRAPLAISSPLTKRQESRERGLAQMQYVIDYSAEWAAVGGAAARLRDELISLEQNTPTRH